VEGFHAARKTPRSSNQRPESQVTRRSSSPDSVPGWASFNANSSWRRPRTHITLQTIPVACGNASRPNAADGGADLDHHTGTQALPPLPCHQPSEKELRHVATGADKDTASGRMSGDANDHLLCLGSGGRRRPAHAAPSPHSMDVLVRAIGKIVEGSLCERRSPRVMSRGSSVPARPPRVPNKPRARVSPISPEEIPERPARWTEIKSPEAGR